MELSIEGIWRGRAGIVDPVPELVADQGDFKFFYMLTSRDLAENLNVIQRVFCDGEMIVMENQTVKKGDPTDTGVFLVPEKFRIAGRREIQIVIEDWDKTFRYESPVFGLTFP